MAASCSKTDLFLANAAKKIKTQIQILTRVHQKTTKETLAIYLPGRGAIVLQTQLVL